MKEKLLFIMPEPLEEALFAVAVYTQYMLCRMIMGRSVDEVTVVCKNEEIHDFIRASWVWTNVVTEPTRQQIDEAEFVHEFNTDSTYRVTEALKKPIAEAFAIKLGAHMMRLLPAILIEDVKERVGTMLVAARSQMDGTDDSWRWPWLENFVDQLKESGVPVTFLSETASWEEIRTEVGRASVVVGVRSSVTLVAAAANRIVMELTPSGKGHHEWMKKPECRTYRTIYGDLVNMSPMFVWGQIERLLKEVKGPKMVPEGIEVSDV